jgi:hypothetical protein
VRNNIWKFREEDPNHLMSLLVQPGDDHFNSAPELGQYVALFLRKTAEYRLPKELPAGDGPVKPLAVKLEDGWLTDADLHQPKFAATPYAEYQGDKTKAMWHFDKEIADATERVHRNLGRHQVIESPKGQWMDEGDGWTFRAGSEWLTVGPEKFGGKIGNQPLEHSRKPFSYRSRQTDPVVQVGPDTFRAVRLTRGKNPGFSICAYHPGDETFRATYRWGSIAMPKAQGKPQTIAFPAIGDLPAKGNGVELKAAASSGLPVYYEVDYGPVVVEAGRLRVSDLPTNPQFPIPCSVTAYQIGRRVGDAVAPAEPVAVMFNIVK